MPSKKPEGQQTVHHERYADFYASKYGHLARTIRTAGPLTLIDAKQPAGDLSGGATNEIFLVRTLSRGCHHIDFGNGRQSGRWRNNDFAVCPPQFANSVISDTPHHIQIFSVHFPAIARLDTDDLLPSDGDFASLHSRSRASDDLSAFLTAVFRGGHINLETLAAETMIIQLFTHLKSLTRQPFKPPAGLRERLHRRAAHKVIERLSTHDLPAPSLAELAGLCGLSASHFCRAFRAETGLPPHRFQIVQKIAKARELLSESRLPVATIAQQLGYDDPAYFSRIFSRETGFSPRDWRRESST